MQRLSLCMILLTSIISQSAQYPGGGNKKPFSWGQRVVYIQAQKIRGVIIRPTPPLIKMDEL